MNRSEHALQSPYDLRGAIAELGYTQSGFARRLQELGDDRPVKNILRTVQRMIAGDARVSGEIRAFIGLSKEVQVARQVDVKGRLDAIDERIGRILARLEPDAGRAATIATQNDRAQT
jgi:hypothetical protein